MSITCHIFVIHSCPEDRSSAWINIKHSEFPEIPPECFLGVSGRSWTVALAAVRLCSQPPWSRCTPPSSSPTHCSPMCTPSSTMTGWRVKNRAFLACVSLGAGHALSFPANSMEHCSTRFQNLRECGINSRYGLHSRTAPVGNRGKGEIVLLGRKDVSHAPLLS